MFNYDNKEYYKIIGIDPGTETMGVSILTIDIDTLSITSINATTYYSSKLPVFIDVSLAHGERVQKQYNIKYNIFNILNKENPHLVCCEAPFINMNRPAAITALNEVTTIVRNTVIDYDNQLRFIMVEPSKVKNAVGAPGNCDKNVIKNVCKTKPDISSLINLDSLDEHSIDSICVAYHGYNILKEGMKYGFY